MRLMVLGAVLIGGLALADVPGPKWRCTAPPSCVSCRFDEQSCIDDAVDAGLILSDCVSGVGAPRYFVCPPGVTPTASCSCSSGGGALLLALLAVLRLSRR